MKHEVLTTCRQVTTFELDDYLVLYSANSQSIFVLTPTAALVWSWVDAGTTLSEAASTLAREAGIAESRARSDIEQIVSQWADAGLLGDTLPSEAGRTRDPFLRSIRSSGSETPACPPGMTDGQDVFRILDFAFRFCSSDSALVDEAGELFAYLRCSSADPDDPPSLISIRQTPNEWRLFCNSDLLATCKARENVLTLIYTYVHMLGYLQSSAFAAVHGAAVSDGDNCVLLPGESGNGKSTLTAVLAASGMSCRADDIAVLSPPPIRLRSFPARIALKEGSWPVLEDRIPQFGELPIHNRMDDQKVKYVLPEPIGFGQPGGTDMRVTHLVFPKYTSGAEGRLEPIPRAVALTRLTQAGYDVPERISVEWVGALTDWMRELECYALEFGHTDDAVSAVKGLLSRC